MTLIQYYPGLALFDGCRKNRYVHHAKVVSLETVWYTQDNLRRCGGVQDALLIQMAFMDFRLIIMSSYL